MKSQRPVEPLRVRTTVDGETRIAPSQGVPAEHPSGPSTPHAHSRHPSRDSSSPRKVPHARQKSSVRPLPTRSKSASLSFPTLLKSDIPDINTTATPNTIVRKPLATPPPTEPNFLTALAAQERHVLELKEELAKAEDNLTRLKKQWVTHEARKRQIESRGIHRMTSAAGSKPANSTGGTDPASLGIMYEDMAKRKATLDSARGGPRRRYFSGSRHIRSLSLVSPDTLRRYADDTKPMTRQTAKTVSGHFDGLSDSPTFMPPTPDLIREEEGEDTEPSTTSQRSSRSPQRERIVRSSVQMASEFREGLWTFFEDLKQATYGEETRNAGSQTQRAGRMDPPLWATVRRQSPTRSPAASPAMRPVKQTVRRQTWQFKAPDVQPDTLITETGSPRLTDQDREAHKTPVLTRSAASPRAPAMTPPRVVMREREFEGEKWQTWDTPTSTMSATRSSSISSIHQPGSDSPLVPNGSPPTSNSSIDVTPRPSTAIDPPRDSIPWPALNKLRPTQLRRTASHLMDEWEKSLTSNPHQSRSTGLRPPHQSASSRPASPRSASPRPESPRPSSRRGNSRLDATYS